MGALSPVAKQQFFDANGNLLAGGKLYTYVSGASTTPLATYTDAALSVANANPVILDARGEAIIYLQDRLYRYVLKDANDVTIWTRDNVASPLYQGALGGTSPIIVANIAALEALTGMSNDALAQTIGYHTDNDGGHGTYRYDSTSTDTVNGGTVINAAGGVGRWLLRHNGVVTCKQFGAKFNWNGTAGDDDTSAIQSCIDAMSGVGESILDAGRTKITATLYLKANKTKLKGMGDYITQVDFVNGAGGTAIAGHTNSLSTITDCEISGFFLFGDVSTGFSKGIDITTMSYSRFDISVQGKRANCSLYYGQGNNGASPYYNHAKSRGLFGNTDYTQKAFFFDKGAWAGGSDGPNANIIGPVQRSALLAGVIDLVSGQGNLFSDISGESIGDYYIRLNNVASYEDTGTSSGSNNQVTFRDTSKTWTVNAFTNMGLSITSGTGAGQSRIIVSNTATALTLSTPFAVLPDATSTYTISDNGAIENHFVNIRAEGLDSLNPDFIIALPGTYGNTVSGAAIQSLGSGLYVRDTSGATNNKWFGNGSKVTFTEVITNPGASYNQDIYPRSSTLGGVMLSDFVVEWLSVSCNSVSHGDAATVYLDVGGTAAATGSDLTLTAVLGTTTDIAFAMPGATGKVARDGTNKHVFLNVQTGPAFSATADLVITWCVTVDV